MTDYLTVIEVLAIHQDRIDRHKSSEGIRDMGLLEVAWFRPQTGYCSDLIEKAAALWESLAQNHPFTDGKKRVAFAVTQTFLMMNGARIIADADGTFIFISRLYQTKTFEFVRLAAWL